MDGGGSVLTVVSGIVLAGLLFDWAFRKVRLPGLIGLLVLGVLIGPYVFGLITDQAWGVSQELRMMALIVILLRAGFEISRRALAKVGSRAVMMAFVPCVFEVAAVILVAPAVLGISHLEAAILGSVLGAVSPAIVVPFMVQFIEEGRGAKNDVPTLILAGASCDDAVAIVLCTSFVGMYAGGSVNVGWNLASIPISVVTGISVGLLTGLVLYRFFDRFNPRATKQTLIVMGIAVFLIALQDGIVRVVPFSALLSIMAIGFIILEKDEHVAHKVSSKLGKMWILAHLLLFTLVGAQVDIPIAVSAGLGGALVVVTGLAGRSVAVQLCLLRSRFSMKERLFATVSYLPKATVQAAIGAFPLAAMRSAGMDTGPGELILAVAVLSIVLTAPLGAVLTSWAGRRLLEVTAESARESPAMEAALESR